jgi:hypothetical protein
MAKTLGLVKRKELEEGALVVLEFHLELNCGLAVSRERVDASVVLPNETLKLSRSVSQLRGGLGKDLVRVGLMHVVCHGLAALVHLVSSHETASQRIVFLELVVSGCLVVTEHGGDSQVLGTSVENDLCGLTCWRSHIHCS